MTEHDLKFDVVSHFIASSPFSILVCATSTSRSACVFISWPTTIHAEATLFLISAKIVVYTMSPGMSWLYAPHLPWIVVAWRLGHCGNSGCTRIRWMLCLLSLLLLPPHCLVAVMQIVVYCPARPAAVAADCANCNIRQCICL